MIGIQEPKKKRKSYDYYFKIIVLGDANVGKTSILKRLVEDQFLVIQRATTALDFKTKNFLINDYVIKL